MPLPRPTLQECIDQCRDDLNSRLPGSDSRLRRAFVGVLAIVLGGMEHLMWGKLVDIANQQFPDTADLETLQAMAAGMDLDIPVEDVAAGPVVFAGAGTIAHNTLVQRSDGWEYKVSDPDTDITEATPIGVKSVNPGAEGNALEGVILTLVTPIPGIEASATVGVGGLVDGTDPAGKADLVAAIQDRWRNPPSGGTDADWERWVRSISSKYTRVWPSAGTPGSGTVRITFVFDARPDIFPLDADLTFLSLALQAFRPVEVTTLDVFACTPDTVDFDITLTPNTPEVQAAVQAQIADLFLREAAPGGTIPLSHINEAISLAAGETDHVLNSPSANVVAGADELSVPGAFTWS